MKILIASDLHYPVINGVATFSRNLARGLAARGHEVVVIAPSQTGKHSEETDENYRIVRTVSVPFPFYQNIRVSLNPGREVKRVIDRFQPDVIHIQMLMWIGQAAMRYGKKYDIPVVSTNHAMPENLMDNLRLLAPLSRPISYVLTEYGRYFHSKADLVTMPTQSAIEMFSETKKMTVPIRAVSNGIDLKRFMSGKVSGEIVRKFGLPSDNTPIVSYVGRLDGEKHLWVLLEAFARVIEHTSAHLLIVGDGTDTQNLKLRANELGIMGYVTFTGRVTDEEICCLHRIGKVFVMPSPAELQSIATLEAMASGQPIVAVDAGALSELCQDGRNGYLCEKDDVEHIARSVLHIITHPDEQKKFSEASLAIARTHDIEHTLDEFISIYSDLSE